MNHISALKVGCGKFFHGKNVLCLLPDEIRRLGGKALVIGGKNSMKAFLDQPMIGDLLISPDIECQMIEFSGECTVARAKQYADTALKEKARRERIAKKEERRKVKAEMKAKKEALHEARQNRKIAKMQEQINELNKEVKEEKVEKPVVEEVKPEQHEHRNKPEYRDTQKPNNSHPVDSFEDKFNQMFKH